jgi:hypothetical protein
MFLRKRFILNGWPKTLKPLEVIVWMIFEAHASKQGEAYPGEAFVVSLVGHKRPWHVRKAMAVLVDKGLLRPGTEEGRFFVHAESAPNPGAQEQVTAPGIWAHAPENSAPSAPNPCASGDPLYIEQKQPVKQPPKQPELVAGSDTKTEGENAETKAIVRQLGINATDLYALPADDLREIVRKAQDAPAEYRNGRIVNLARARLDALRDYDPSLTVQRKDWDRKKIGYECDARLTLGPSKPKCAVEFWGEV